ncbi:MAG: HK97 gp10 family phage protein [Candidatus Pristimantibacillus lignocellulolyticus]|uniref:HK97 gp10 family phage protein n=1 Tax=Candidatus Pristimantibacillus lignocellulolyticus TaxID=2994561 RepID=A0A9J6ZEU8_9BACL|nr:MAG: HK97 gp10 family phage protein [Candidatus Pristimantibacillus lignocellulolyticus]
MAKTNFELTGIDNLLKGLRQRGEQAVKSVESKALREAGKPMAEAMKGHAARSSFSRRYHLQDNIVVSNVKKKDGVKYVLVGPNKKVAWRAHFPEFGTSNQSASPYIEPGFNDTKTVALQILASVIRKGLRS